MRHLIPLALCLTTSVTLAANGILELDSKPGGAVVFVDGKKKGVTPETEGQKLTMELAEGDHEVVIKKEGVGSATRKVFIGEGVIQPLTLTIMAEAFTNALGMKFVPVPGTKVLMCIHETRNKDYAAYAAENRGVDMSWKGAVFSVVDVKVVNSKKYIDEKKYTINEDDTDHPVVNVAWEDASAFCAWLSGKEGRTYRLPTDHEWSCAVGIGDQENARDTPEAKNNKIPGVYPWGSIYPPPKNNVGNHWDSTSAKKAGTTTNLGTYEDGALLTTKVMTYPANKLGIYDLDGNVQEWCQDLYKPGDDSRVSRGGSWNHDNVMSSSRDSVGPGPCRYGYRGFRCVMVIGGGSP